MTAVSGTMNGETLTLCLCGKVDSVNAPETEKEITDLIEEKKPAHIIVDAAKLEYMASAGLRIMLRLRKKYEDLKIINVSNEVFEVFEMTGFSELIHTEKALRTLSTDGCEVIGEGSNGIVYRLNPDTIIKVYKNPDCFADITRERELARKAFVMGIPTAIPFDVVRVRNTYGSVFELLNAESFSKLIMANPQDVDKYTDMYVDLLKKIHSTVVDDGSLPNYKDKIIDCMAFIKGQISEENHKKLTAMIDAIPEDMHMIHGDYHTKNLEYQNGEVILIDMDTLSVGNKVFEFANMFNSYIGYGESLPKEQRGAFIGLNDELVHKIWNRTLHRYFETDDEEKLKAIESKAQIIGYARMLRRSMRREADTEDGKRHIEHCRQRLEELIPLTDSLTL